MTNGLSGADKTPEQKKKRDGILKKVLRLFNKLGVETYGDAFKTEVISPDAISIKSKGSSTKKSKETADDLSSLTGVSESGHDAKEDAKQDAKEDASNATTRTRAVQKLFDDEAKEVKESRQKSRPKYPNKKGYKESPQDLFETTPKLSKH